VVCFAWPTTEQTNENDGVAVSSGAQSGGGAVVASLAMVDAAARGVAMRGKAERVREAGMGLQLLPIRTCRGKGEVEHSGGELSYGRRGRARRCYEGEGRESERGRDGATTSSYPHRQRWRWQPWWGELCCMLATPRLHGTL
jgi:hypothetical protein